MQSSFISSSRAAGNIKVKASRRMRRQHDFAETELGLLSKVPRTMQVPDFVRRTAPSMSPPMVRTDSISATPRLTHINAFDDAVE
jgi:hypothetical protein